MQSLMLAQRLRPYNLDLELINSRSEDKTKSSSDGMFWTDSEVLFCSSGKAYQTAPQTRLYIQRNFSGSVGEGLC